MLKSGRVFEPYSDSFCEVHSKLPLGIDLSRLKDEAINLATVCSEMENEDLEEDLVDQFIDALGSTVAMVDVCLPRIQEKYGIYADAVYRRMEERRRELEKKDLDELVRPKKLNRNDIVSILTLARLPVDQYWVSFGAALVLYGVKDTTNDIDCGCKPELIDSLIKEGFEPVIMPDGSRSIKFGNCLTLYENWSKSEHPYMATPSVPGKSACRIPVADLQVIYDLKKEKGRPKDILDCNLIEAYWEENRMYI